MNDVILGMEQQQLSRISVCKVQDPLSLNYIMWISKSKLDCYFPLNLVYEKKHS